jgi:hypothetical protein
MRANPLRDLASGAGTDGAVVSGDSRTAPTSGALCSSESMWYYNTTSWYRCKSWYVSKSELLDLGLLHALLSEEDDACPLQCRPHFSNRLLGGLTPLLLKLIDSTQSHASCLGEIGLRPIKEGTSRFCLWRCHEKLLTLIRCSCNKKGAARTMV